MSYWQTCWKILAQVPKKLPDNSKREMNFYILTKKSFRKMTLWTSKGQFWHRGWKSFARVNFLGSDYEKSEIKILSIKKDTTPPNVTLGM